MQVARVFLIFFRQLLCGSVLTLALVAGIRSAPAATTASDFLLDLWTSDDDLPDSSVSAIAQTPDGYLWIGTFNGLARFDGIRFVHFDPLNTPALKHARVTGLFLDGQGALWINTYDGSLTVLRNGVFTHEWEGGQISAIFFRSNRIYLALTRGQLISRAAPHGTAADWQEIQLAGVTTGFSFREDAQGTLWFNTRDGMLGRIAGTNYLALPRDSGLRGDRVNHLSADASGQIWVGTDQEVARWNGTRFEEQTPHDPTDPKIASWNVTYLFCPTNNDCWAVADGRVWHWRNRTGLTELKAWPELTTGPTSYLGNYQDRRGRVWFRSFGQGLFYANPDGSAHRLSTAHGLPNDRVTCWFEDAEGNIWLGVERGGLVRLREKQIQVIGPAQGVQVPAISSVCEDAERSIWFGTFGGGLYRWRDNTLTPFTLAEGAKPKSFFSVYPAGADRLWLSAGQENFYILENGEIRAMPDPAHGIKSLLADRTGRLWIGRQNGLACWTNGTLIQFGARAGFERIDVRAIAEDAAGRLWFGTGNGRLWKYEAGQFASYQPKDSLANQAIWSLLPDADGTLWIGTFRGGLLRFKAGVFTRYTSREGLPSDVLCQLLDDDQGRLWVGSHKGIFQLPKSALREFDEGRIESLPCVSYGLYDGLPTLECTGNYQPSGWRGQDGRLWFATVKGLVTIHPNEISADLTPPPVRIEEVQLSGKPLPLQPSDRLVSAPLEIPPGRHQLDFRFTALSFTAPDKVRFRYRLTGFDPDWVRADTKRTAHYGPLPPGQYRFEVAACNNNGVWNPQTASVALTVLPQFWQTWWFQLLTVTSIIGVTIGTVRFTVTRRLQKKMEALQQQRAIERERERIAKDIHDDLGAGLTQILLQSSLARRDSQGQVQADLTQISDTARSLVRSMDEIVWAINPENDTLDDLATYLGKFVQDYVTSAGKRCRIIMPTELPTHKLSADARHNLYLAVKEALHNAAKHARATEICFQLNVQPAGLDFVIKDDGAGFQPHPEKENPAASSRINSGHGLRNITQRLAGLGGHCTITSTPGKGTTVTLHLPLPTRSTRNHEDH
jgi:ligand-binding sensor domain-containing protein/signal transduction histidine kinase